MNKVILITGASSGIGEGIARELGKAGAKVFLGARRLDRIHALADEIRSAGGEAEAQVLDVTSRQSMAAFVQAARDKWGRIDVLINNAGIMPLSPLSAGKQDEWERTIDVNIKGVLWGYWCCFADYGSPGLGADRQYRLDWCLGRRAHGRRLLRDQICGTGHFRWFTPGKFEHPCDLRQPWGSGKRTGLDHYARRNHGGDGCVPGYCSQTG